MKKKEKERDRKREEKTTMDVGVDVFIYIHIQMIWQAPRGHKATSLMPGSEWAVYGSEVKGV